MRADAAEAERRHEVREAAAGWRRAGAVDEATLGKIVAAYPDDRSRLGPVFRVLVFGFTIVAVNGFFGLFGLAVATAGQSAMITILLLFGLSLVGATEFQIGSLKRAQGGTESATAFLGLCYLIGGLLWIIGEARVGDEAQVNAGLFVGSVVLALAAYRWGYVACALGATTGVFLLVARGPHGRLWWVIAGLAAAPFLMAAADSIRLPPAHRRCCRGHGRRLPDLLVPGGTRRLVGRRHRRDGHGTLGLRVASADLHPPAVRRRHGHSCPWPPLPGGSPRAVLSSSTWRSLASSLRSRRSASTFTWRPSG